MFNFLSCLQSPFILFIIFIPSLFCQATESISVWNPKVSILGTLAKFTIFEIEYAAHPNWTFGVGYTQLAANQSNKSIKLSGVKFYGNYFFKPIQTDSYWLGFYNGTNKVYSTSVENEQLAKLNMQTNSFGLRAGYHWWWDHWNLSLAYSLGLSTVKKVKIYDSLGNLTEAKEQAGLESGPEFFLGYFF